MAMNRRLDNNERDTKGIDTIRYSRFTTHGQLSVFQSAIGAIVILGPRFPDRLALLIVVEISVERFTFLA
jgi:hypothetical protein